MMFKSRNAVGKYIRGSYIALTCAGCLQVADHLGFEGASIRVPDVYDDTVSAGALVTAGSSV